MKTDASLSLTRGLRNNNPLACCTASTPIGTPIKVEQADRSPHTASVPSGGPMFRGLRNNNPLNLRISPARWLGKLPAGQRTDTQFEQFSVPVLNARGEQIDVAPFVAGSPEQRVWGYRAAIRNLRTYFRSCGCKTIEDVVARWAPASDSSSVQNGTSAVKTEKAGALTPCEQSSMGTPKDADNDPVEYATVVSRLTGWSEERVLHFDEATICRLVSAMAQVESAIRMGTDDALIREAWRLA